MARRTVTWLLALTFAAAAAGCRSRSDLVEAELRTKDRQLRDARGELLRAETMNEALENTLRDQRLTQPACRTGPLGQVKDIQLGRGTGGIDEDRVAGDEGLQIVLVPRDVDASAIKAAGILRVTSLEITPEGIKVPLSMWDVTALQLRQTWRSGLLSTGYHVTLPWQTLPRTEKLRIVAQFQPLEGGVFEAEKDVTVRLLAEAVRPGHAIPLPAGGPGSPLPAMPGPELPVGPPPRLGMPAIPPPEQLQPPRQPGMPVFPTMHRKPAVQILLPVPGTSSTPSS